MNLEDVRLKIDQIDDEIIKLLEQRMDLVLDIAKIKQEQNKEIFDATRETSILDTIAKKVHNPLYRSTLVHTYKDIMKHSKSYQQDFLEKTKNPK